ncbi:MAG: hypothetical protein KatS3mg011_1074 [Acidimicrobiia bacterium]|nr:MAG: hypothetical protein KatS3mg011_1074 [Acidimicrobiia bacterium]
MPRKWWAAIRSERIVTKFVAVGLATVVALAAVVAVGSWRWRAEEHAAASRSLIADLSGALEVGLAELRAVRGLFDASEEVTWAEFARFTTLVGASPGMEMVGFARWVDATELSDFESATREELDWFRLGDLGTGPRHLIVLYENDFTIRPRLAGSDLLADPSRRDFLVQLPDGGGVRVLPGLRFELFMPVRSQRGVVFSMIDLSSHVEIPSDVSLEIGLHDYSAPSPWLWQGELDVGGGSWPVSVHRAGPPSWLIAPLSVLAVGTILALGSAVLAGYRADARRRGEEAERLRRISREKDLFLAAVSHELRTPLTAVVGLLAVLKDGWSEMAPEEIEEYLGLCSAEASDLADLVEDLLTLGRLEAGSLTYHPTITDVVAETEKVVSRLGIEVSGFDLRDAWIDPMRFRQIVRNLAVNAVKYGEKDRIVEFSQGDGELVVAVCSDGPPIPPDRVESLFQPYQGMAGDLGKPGSIGLGLYISRRMAREMGGDLRYRRRGRFNVFEVVLPVSPRSVTLAGKP